MWLPMWVFDGKGFTMACLAVWIRNVAVRWGPSAMTRRPSSASSAASAPRMALVHHHDAVVGERLIIHGRPLHEPPLGRHSDGQHKLPPEASNTHSVLCGATRH